MSYIEIPIQFSPLLNAPLDKRTKISSLLALSVELPLAVRSEGIPVWVTSEQVYYTFEGGVENINFVPIVKSDNIRHFTINLSESTPNGLSEIPFYHGLGDIKIVEIQVIDLQDNDKIMCSYRKGGLGGLSIEEYVSLKIGIFVQNILVDMLYVL